MFERQIPDIIWFEIYKTVHYLKFINVLKEFYTMIKAGKDKQLVNNEINTINNNPLSCINSHCMWSNRKNKLCLKN